GPRRSAASQSASRFFRDHPSRRRTRIADGTDAGPEGQAIAHDLLSLVLDEVAVRRCPVVRRPPVILIDTERRQEDRRIETSGSVLFCRQHPRFGAEEGYKPLCVLRLAGERLVLGTVVHTYVEVGSEPPCQRDGTPLDYQLGLGKLAA